MKNVLIILPESIGGRLTTSSIKDGFIQNGFKVSVYDELYDKTFKNDDYSLIAGYDFSPVKFKIENNLKTPVLAYFSDEIYSKTSGPYYKKYFPYLKNEDIFVFLWDRFLSKEDEKIIYQPHFVNVEIYKDFLKPQNDVLFMGRLDSEIRLETFLELNKKLPNLKFSWCAIKRHFDDAILRCKDDFERNILKNAYKGFIDNEKDMAKVINLSKIVYNINAQGMTSLNYRTIQTLACKRLLISDERKELDLFNNIIPVYNDINDLANKITYYLNNKREYEKITSTCQKIIQEKLNSKICVQKMLSKINF